MVIKDYASFDKLRTRIAQIFLFGHIFKVLCRLTLALLENSATHTTIVSAKTGIQGEKQNRFPPSRE
jgi:hypothetical protein